MPASQTNYSSTAFANTAALKNSIVQVANELGVNPEVIFGALVEENHDYLAGTFRNWLGDTWATASPLSHTQLLMAYKNAKEQGKLDSHSGLDKANVILNDIGPFNIKIGTAITLIQEYAAQSSVGKDPLNLLQYVNDYPKLVQDLMNGTAAPSVAGLMILKADKYFISHVDADYWSGLSMLERDALRVTFYNFGPVTMEKNRLENIKQNGGDYRPKPGLNTGGGENHIFNAQAIGLVLGNSDYAAGPLPNYGDISDDVVELVSGSASIFVKYQNIHSASLNSGGSLSHIVALERANGNNISSDDIKLINGLQNVPDTAIPADTPLMIPIRNGDWLTINTVEVSLSFNRVTGENSAIINSTYDNTTILNERVRDAAGNYSDRYVKTDNLSGLVIEEKNTPVGPGYGTEFVQPDVINTVNLITHAAGQVTENGYSDPTTSAASEGIGAGNFDYTASMNASLLNFGDLYWQGVQSSSLTGGYRLGNGNLSNTSSLVEAVSKTADSFADYQNQSLDEIFRDAASLTNAGSNTPLIPADPLILDLNGDGVRLVNYDESKAFFDIDNDGGSKEHTGWVSAEDGILVHDLNGNGVIETIQETLSEYYNGVAGSDGNAGTRPYTDGFAALKSLDANHDNVFNDQDTSWSELRIWVDDNSDGKSFKDANNNGIQDSGEASELKTLVELGITQINLASEVQSGLINSGNEVLSSGSFIQGGQVRDAQAVRFIANPNGSTFSHVGNGSVITTEGNNGGENIKSYASANADSTISETLDASTLNVANLYAGAGNDTLNGDAQDNWLAGSLGSDAFNAGDGDDVLLIDASDLQANIHAGDGNDVVQVVGNGGVTLNLAKSEAEVAIGGVGNDVLIGGGRSTVFILGGGGNDTIIGGAANDVLNGEDGSDFIDGGAGNDLIRGQRGQDELSGGRGDDVVDGGLEDDRLSGNEGNDVLIGSRGDDMLDGGDGIDVAQFSGSYADYRITKLVDTANRVVYRVVDAKAGRDGADTLVDIEKLSFADVGDIDVTLDNPMPVKDVITISDRTSSKLIKVSDLLANDRDWQGDALHITNISDVIGGTIQGVPNAAGEIVPTLTVNGEITFIPDPNYSGVMGFKYKVADSDGTAGAIVSVTGTEGGVEARGQVFIRTPDMPSDTAFTDQWYLSEINVLPVWKDYTGKGVRIAQFEPSGLYATGKEIFDYRHPDLASSVDAAWLADPNNVPAQSFSQHATLVAGVIAASRNGEGAVGVAYGATIAGYQIGDTLEFNSPLEAELDFENLYKLKDYDVSNNSWGFAGQFEYFSRTVPSMIDEFLKPAVVLGRNGLGSNIVMAGGNTRQSGGNTNYSELTANRFVITTGAINARGDLSTLTSSETPFSNPGASILVSAPGSNVASTSRMLIGDDGTVFGKDIETAQGTSFAAPIVSGVVALMLEANINLGYRDVQQILALTAKKVSDPNTDNTYNGAKNWNGGGMHTSHDYGFGQVDARAAVRLAETWLTQHNAYNERHLSNGEGSVNGGSNLNLAINDGATVTRNVSIGAGIRAEHVAVTIDVVHSNWNDLVVELVSPSGTVSKLVSNPGANLVSNPDMLMRPLQFTFDTTHSWGENVQGDWQLRIVDRSGLGTGILNGWKLDVYGSDFNETGGWEQAGDIPLVSAIGNDSYFYTDEFSETPGSSRATLVDSNGGTDTLNAAAVSNDLTINLNNGATSTIAGRNLTISGDIEWAFGGDGNDTITGNALSNRLQGGRGADLLSGGGGGDFLDGGVGADTLTGGGDGDLFVIHKEANGIKTITDFNPAGGAKILLVGFADISDFTGIGVIQEGNNVRLNLGSGQSVLLLNITTGQISEQAFGFFSDNTMLRNYTIYMSSGPVGFVYGDTAENMLLPNNLSTVRFFSMGGDDVLGSQTGNDLIDGGNGNDVIWGEYPGYAPAAGSDWIEGGAGNDTLYGGGGAICCLEVVAVIGLKEKVTMTALSEQPATT